MDSNSDIVAAERTRIEAEYVRRERAIAPDLYAPWQPAQIFMDTGRKRVASMLLRRAGLLPLKDQRCLEVGFGSMGWLLELINWGVSESDLHGIELSAERAERARQTLPHADLRVGDAASLPWENDHFKLVIVSTVLTSILDQAVRTIVAREIVRVIAPGGALLWYDFAVNNPKNPNVRGVSKRELYNLFPELTGEIKSVTLAPPLARFVAPRSWAIASFLESIPLLRTHLLGLLMKRA